jgi:hypothetical protein
LSSIKKSQQKPTFKIFTGNILEDILRYKIAQTVQIGADLALGVRSLQNNVHVVQVSNFDLLGNQVSKKVFKKT